MAQLTELYNNNAVSLTYLYLHFPLPPPLLFLPGLMHI